MSLLISHFWTATVLTFLKNGLELLKEKALKIIPKDGRTEAQSSPWGSGKVVTTSISDKSKMSLRPKLDVFTTSFATPLCLLGRRALHFC